jgi:predicted ATP-grasp superfamily ATP-dependent carboligase
MKDELGKYAVRFSNYEGGSTIGTYILDKAERRKIEFLAFYSIVPAYDFSELSNSVQGMRVENDYKAWYDLVRRFNHMFGLQIDLSDLEKKSDDLLRSISAKIKEIDRQLPELNVQEYMERLSEEFNERSFEPLSDVWERGLRDLFGDED